MQPALVNIGCGATWHPSWTNLDVHPLSPQVRSWDVSHGLPFGTEQVDACYASHVLEHLTRAQARALLLESFRVLRPGGIIRLVVPDLEAIVREYLDVVARADKGEEAALSQYEWIRSNCWINSSATSPAVRWSTIYEARLSPMRTMSSRALGRRRRAIWAFKP